MIETLRRRHERIQQRIAELMHEANETQEQLTGLQSATEVYRSVHGLPKREQTVNLADYHNLSMRDVLRKWAHHHAGRVVTQEMSHALAPGLFSDSRGAQSTLFRELTRRKDEFRRISRGVYQLIEASDRPQQKALPVGEPAKTQDRPSLRATVLAALQEARGQPIHSQDLLRRIREMGADTKAKDPISIIDLVVFHLKEAGHQIAKTAPHTWALPTGDQTGP